MRYLRIAAALFAVALVVPGFAKESFKLMNAEELSKLIDQKSPDLFIFDANGSSTRESEGVIPGAHLLSSYRGYDVASELPKKKDAKLVFYCANTQCMASHAAAERATEAGYNDVNVMADGIMGWSAAGKSVAKP